MSKRVRIAISGPVGAGKTTLATALAETLGVRMLPENHLAMSNARRAFRRVENDPAASAEARENALRAWMQSLLDWCIDRDGFYRSDDGFVSDRWEMDVFVSWLRLFQNYPVDEQTKMMRSILLMRAEEIDAVVLLPVTDEPIEPMNEDGLQRSTGLASRLLTYHSLRGVLDMLPTRVLRYQPRSRLSLEESMRDVLAGLERGLPRE